MKYKAVRSQLKPLVFSGQPLSSIENDYARYYKIDCQTISPAASHEMGYLDCQNYRIACHVYHPVTPKKTNDTFFLVHGYYDHMGLYKHIISYFLEQGYKVFAYDLPGHGLSSGKPATIPDFSIYSDVLASILRQCEMSMSSPWHAYGQSTGGAIVTDYLLRLTQQNKVLPFKKVVLSAPLVRPCLWSMRRLMLYLLRPFLKQTPRTFPHNSRDKQFVAFVRQDPLAAQTLPTQWVTALDRWIKRTEKAQEKIALHPLIIQGTNDRTVDAHHNLSVLKKLYQDPELLMLKSARHHLANELASTRKEYMSWLSLLLSRNS
ncbi:MAG: alpha/beta hydrolase [Endozoicomonas sp. (ex Botrylloides leachii)]|nr:alpha/beta hydrolase [Endozoicomonas sp. (ex Botrylloides leachii)]